MTHPGLHPRAPSRGLPHAGADTVAGVAVAGWEGGHADLEAPGTGLPGVPGLPLDRGWEAALVPADVEHPSALPPDVVWVPARVPGTIEAALREAGRASEPGRGAAAWYRVPVPGDGPERLRFDGLAPLAEAWLDGAPLLRSESMFLAQEAEAVLRPDSVLHLRFRRVDAVPAPRGARPRWRPRLVDTASLRGRRASLLGHMPGWCGLPPPLGPHRAVWRVRPAAVGRCRLHATLPEGRPLLRCSLRLAGAPAGPLAATLHVGARRLPVTLEDGSLDATLEVPGVAAWWPHAHGTPALHAVALEAMGALHPLGRVGFRSISVDRGADGMGFGLVVNGVPVFARGACWTAAGRELDATREACAPWLHLAREAGMTMIRVPGLMAYEAPAFHALCDELGLLVWQDCMFANFDYPQDEAFLDLARAEVGQLLGRLHASPSLAVLCGGSEVAQQAAMLGLPAAGRAHRLFEAVIPETAERLRPGLASLPNTPWGGEPPFREDQGVAHYYGVGAYRRPLEDARRANVRFAAECLAFAQVPVAATLADALPGVPPQAPAWKRTVPRDPGAPWDFEDVRDHYLALLYGVDPARTRAEDPERYADLSRAVGADLLELTLSEWRRPGSTCRGALVWQLQDLLPGIGWGVIDARGRPKPAWHGMRRVLAPVQVLLSDEGLNGLALHVLNEPDRPLEAVLSLACLRDGAVPVRAGERAVCVPPRGALSLPDAVLFDGFFDATHARRFGPCAHDVTVATLRDAATGAILSEAFHFPRERLLARRELGLEARLRPEGAGWSLALSCRSLAQAVHLDVPGWRLEREWFHLPPGPERVLRLLPDGEPVPPSGELRCLNANPVTLRPAP